MELEIIQRLEDVLENESKKLQNDTILAGFEKASREFDELVASGITKRRGYNLMTIMGNPDQLFPVSSNLR
jgi:hypothetical protein